MHGAPPASRRRRGLARGRPAARRRATARAVGDPFPPPPADGVRTRRARARIGALAVAAAVLLGIALDGPLRAARAQRALLARFQAKVVDPQTRTVRFEWAFRPKFAQDAFTCTLDPDADRLGVVDASIPNCERDTALRWSYEEPGTYTAVLVVTRRLGGSDRAAVEVEVGPAAASGERPQVGAPPESW